VVSSIDPVTGECSHELQRSDKRGDLLVIVGAKRFLVDVTIPRATAPSTIDGVEMAATCQSGREHQSSLRAPKQCNSAVSSGSTLPASCTTEKAAAHPFRCIYRAIE
jgi:hypothetical protein